MIRVGVVGYGTIGKRVADAIAKQGDMKLVGVLKVTPDYEAEVAAEKGYPIYTFPDRLEAFKQAGIDVEGTIEDLVRQVDVIVDASPEDVGAENKEKYYKPAGKPAIFQGGEEADVAEMSFHSLWNYEEASGKRYIRVVSCNTTGILRVLSALRLNGIGIRRVRVFIARRGADPKEYKRGPINDVVPNPASVPSHHGPDAKTVMPDVDIVSMAIAVPVTLMHLHMMWVELDGDYSRDKILDALSSTPRIRLVDTKRGYVSLAQIIEWARDVGRQRADHPEVAVFRDSVTVMGRELYLMYGVHQESIVVPENIDAIRAMFALKPKWESIKTTDESLGLITRGKRYGTT